MSTAFSVSALFEGSLAHYTVSRSSEGVYTAYLLSYSGAYPQPPAVVQLCQTEAGWAGCNGSSDLVPELGYAIGVKQRAMELA